MGYSFTDKYWSYGDFQVLILEENLRYPQIPQSEHWTHSLNDIVLNADILKILKCVGIGKQPHLTAGIYKLARLISGDIGKVISSLVFKAFIKLISNHYNCLNIVYAWTEINTVKPVKKWYPTRELWNMALTDKWSLSEGCFVLFNQWMIISVAFIYMVSLFGGNLKHRFDSESIKYHNVLITF